MAQVGTPGYNFGTSEVITAAKLRTWLRDAAWTNISFSEAPPGMVSILNQTAAAAESLGNIWFNLHNSLTQVYTTKGWTPILDPFTWYSRRFANRLPDAYGPYSLEIYNNGVDLTTAGETNTASFTLGNAQMNEGSKILLSWRGEPYHLGVRQESCGTLGTPLFCGAGIAMTRRSGSVAQQRPGDPAACAGSLVGQVRGVTTSTQQPAWAFAAWMTATLNSGASQMGLVWTIDGPLASGYQAVTGF